MAPLSGFLYCDACGSKMKQHNGAKGEKPAYACGLHSRCGGNICSTHYIKRYLIEATVIADIQAKSRMVLYEADAREKFLAYKSKQNATRSAEEKKHETAVRNRLDELDKLIQGIYEDKVLGRVPEDIFNDLFEKYSAEKSLLLKLKRQRYKADVDEYICRLKSYTGAEKLTRQMCLDLMDILRWIDILTGTLF